MSQRLINSCFYSLSNFFESLIKQAGKIGPTFWAKLNKMLSHPQLQIYRNQIWSSNIKDKLQSKVEANPINLVIRALIKQYLKHH